MVPQSLPLRTLQARMDRRVVGDLRRRLPEMRRTSHVAPRQRRPHHHRRFFNRSCRDLNDVVAQVAAIRVACYQTYRSKKTRAVH